MDNTTLEILELFSLILDCHFLFFAAGLYQRRRRAKQNRGASKDVDAGG
jgi:hypothetical protein